jgi:TolB-like protein
MKRKEADDAGAAGEASRWFVRVDSGDDGAEALLRWLEEQPANERAMQRVKLAVALGKQLAANPRSTLHAEAARAARLRPRMRPLAWSGALAASLLVGVSVVRDVGVPAAMPQAVTMEAARVVAFDAPTSSIAVLPNGVVVDASAVAVLPFATASDITLAVGLERDVVAALRTVPGLYVIADAAVSSYAATDLSPAEIGALLSVRAIVDAGVELLAGRVQASVRLRDAATGATLWHTDFDRPIDELRAVRYEIADGVAATMFDSSLREQAARADRFSGPVFASKPFRQ